MAARTRSLQLRDTELGARSAVTLHWLTNVPMVSSSSDSDSERLAAGGSGIFFVQDYGGPWESTRTVPYIRTVPLQALRAQAKIK
jgi:hypothetical protein